MKPIPSVLSWEDSDLYRDELIRFVRSSFKLHLLFYIEDNLDFLKKLIIEEMNPQIHDIGIGLYDYHGSYQYDSRKILLPNKTSGHLTIIFITPYLDAVIDFENVDLQFHESDESGNIELIEKVHLSAETVSVESMEISDIKPNTTWKFWKITTNLVWQVET